MMQNWLEGRVEALERTLCDVQEEVQKVWDLDLAMKELTENMGKILLQMRKQKKVEY